MNPLRLGALGALFFPSDLTACRISSLRKRDIRQKFREAKTCFHGILKGMDLTLGILPLPCVKCDRFIYLT